jgi:hypothetical protein
VEFWNDLVRSVLAVEPEGIGAPVQGRQTAGRIQLDAQDGQLSRAEGIGIPEYVVTGRSFQRLGLRGTIVARSSYLPLDLIRLAQPASVQWIVSEADPLGRIEEGARARVRIFEGGLPPNRRCVQLGVRGPPGLKGERRYRIAAADRLWTGTVRANEPAVHRIELSNPSRGRRIRRFRDFEITAEGTTVYPDGRRRSVSVEGIGVEPCDHS